MTHPACPTEIAAALPEQVPLHINEVHCIPTTETDCNQQVLLMTVIARAAFKLDSLDSRDLSA